MLLEDIVASDDLKIRKINKVLKETFGFTLVSEMEPGKLNTLYTKIADDLYNLKLNQVTPRDSAYTQKLLVLEGLKILISKNKNRLNEEAQLLHSRGGRAFTRVVKNLADYVTNACEIGDDYEEAINDAMKEYRSSKYRFEDQVIEFEVRKMTEGDCNPIEECGDTVYEDEFDMDMGYEDFEPEANMCPDCEGTGEREASVSSVTPGLRYDCVRCDGAGEIFESSNNDIVVRRKSWLWNRIFSELADNPPSDSDGRPKDVNQLRDLADEKYRRRLDFMHNRMTHRTPRMNEDAGHSITDIIGVDGLEKLRADLRSRGDLDTRSDYYDKLYGYYAFGGLGPDGMPYGTAKGRDGDADQWILNKIEDDYGTELNAIGEDAADDVWGAKPGSGGLLSKILDKLFIYRNDPSDLPYNAEVVRKHLERKGYSEEQIHAIRDAVTKASKTAIERIQKKYGVPEKYISTMDTSFGVYVFFLNVDRKIEAEFSALRKKLAMMKLKDINLDEAFDSRSDRYADRDWVRSIKKDQAKKSGDYDLELSLADPDEEDEAQDYFSYQSKKGQHK